MIKLFLGTVPMLVLVASQAIATILPPNNLHLQDTILASNLTEDEFNEAIDKVEALYSPLIKETFGKELNINRRWTDNLVNASATQFFGTWTVNMYGGLARRPEVSIDGFTLVMCHELGHHLGGYPYVSNWAANEGQSDYFATLSCARELWRDEVDVNAGFRDIVPDTPRLLCDTSWADELDQDLCYRSMMAGKSLADLLSALRETDVSFDTPSEEIVSTTFNSHPEGQCRLDTYMAGALCSASWARDVIPGKGLVFGRNGASGEAESAQYTCSRSLDFEIGVRPRCWFASLL